MFTFRVKRNVPRSSKEIAEMFGISSTVMTKGVKKCQEIIHIKKIKNALQNQNRLNLVILLNDFVIN